MELCVCMRACVRAWVGVCICIAKVVRMNPFVESKWKRAYCQNNIGFVNAAVAAAATTTITTATA